VAAGLGTARDIVTYAVMDRCMWCSDPDKRKANFTERNAINARFRRVLYYGLEVLKPDRITIISHSQGTVIATQMLQNDWVKKKIAATVAPPTPQHASVLLVTMGSPVTHIYRRYFGEVFQVSTQDMPRGMVWHNIFRTDDFVGTTIEDVPGLAGNWEVKAAGHTGYFTDYLVWERLWRDVGLRVF
jgi:pimeloyl-ACP methyl ester carboxylesterase